jgi:hypothetical protein
VYGEEAMSGHVDLALLPKRPFYISGKSECLIDPSIEFSELAGVLQQV